MVKTDSKTGIAALTVAHCAGMVDLVALPVWVGTLISKYGLDPQQAGGLVTLFLVGAVTSSLYFARRFNRTRGRLAVALSFAMAAAAFALLSITRDFAAMAVLHAAAGAAAGCGLSFTHGTIGRSTNPHRLFALVGIGIGFFALAFLAGTPQLVAAVGGQALFQVFAGVMLFAAVIAGLAFPVPDAHSDSQSEVHREAQRDAQTPGFATPARSHSQINPAVWFAVFGVACMALVQAMMFSFVERIGSDRGFGFAAVTSVLIALGLVNLLPSPLAVFMQRRLPAQRVVLAGPMVQAALALTIAYSSGFVPYAVATAVFVAVMIFTHNFAFGLLAALDPSGRAVAATPAMLMVGAAIGPVLGGTLVKTLGYSSLGLAAVVVASLAVASFWRVSPKAMPAAVLA